VLGSDVATPVTFKGFCGTINIYIDRYSKGTGIIIGRQEKQRYMYNNSDIS
jgi:hypothetical protein